MKRNENMNHRSNSGVNEKIPKAVSEHAGTLVKIVDYDPGKHLVKVVKVADNNPLDKDQEVDQQTDQKKRWEQPRSKTVKTSEFPNAPIMEANDDTVSLRGNKHYGMFSYREGGGNIVKGPLSIASEPHQVKLAGLSTLNPLTTSGFPSTIVTPMPMTNWSLPTAGMVKPILTSVLVAGTILAASGALA